MNIIFNIDINYLIYYILCGIELFDNSYYIFMSVIAVIGLPCIYFSGKKIFDAAKPIIITAVGGAAAGATNALVNQGINRTLGSADNNQAGNTGKGAESEGNSGGKNQSNTGKPDNSGK